MKWERIKVYRNILPIDHYLLGKCQCFPRTKHCTYDAWGFTPSSDWASHVRLPAPEECRRAYLPHALVLASTAYGGYRIVIPADEETIQREKARHDFLRTASPLNSPLEKKLYDHWTYKWLRDTHKLKSLTGREALQLFLEKVSAYTPEMLPYVLACGEPPDEDAILDSQAASEPLAAA
jgi:hypothetical protein